MYACVQIVTALALAGDLRFNPLEDTLTGADGKFYMFLVVNQMANDITSDIGN